MVRVLKSSLTVLLLLPALSWGQSISVNSTDYRQVIEMMGGDMERSGRNFHQAGNPQDVIDWCVKDIAFDTWRVGYDKKQELTEGNKDFSVYDSDVLAMKMILETNPDIKFFATMESDYHGYSSGNRNNLPTFIYDYAYVDGAATGTRAFDAVALGVFLADYVEYMEQQGVPISYISMSKEYVQVVTAARSKTAIESMIAELQARGVAIPLIIDACTWSLSQGVNTADNYVSNGANEYIHGYSAHDYWSGETKTWGDFVRAAHDAGKPAFADETGHGGGGFIDLNSEVDISKTVGAYVKKCSFYAQGIQGECIFELWPRGYNEINSNGFYAKPIFFDKSAPSAYRMRSYYVMKQFANNAVGSTYITSGVESLPGVHTMAFRKEDQIALWVMNESTTTYDAVPVSLSESLISGPVYETFWTAETDITGSEGTLTATGSSFVVSIPAKSLTCCVLDAGAPFSPYQQWAVDSFAEAPAGTDQTETGNPDRDLLNNLQEWALVTDPMTFDKPPVNIISDPSSFLITYHRRLDSGVVVRAAWASSLTSSVWNVNGLTEVAIGSSNDVETVAAFVPLDSEARFIRIQVEE